MSAKAATSKVSKEEISKKHEVPTPTMQKVLTGEQTSPAAIFQQAHDNPRALTSGNMLQLQHTVGNQAVNQLLTQQIQTKKNNTGLPDTLKNRMENISGMAMDDVRVHYNSRKPSEVHALAYTQGIDIYVAPGQERHLPHEAWHVVQQKQGRVRPTFRTKDDIQINDDVDLEKEADVLGFQQATVNGPAGQFESKSRKNEVSVQQTVIQLNCDPDPAIHRLWKLAQENPKGFTVFITGNFVPADGFCVGYKDTQNCFGLDGLKKAYAIAKTQDKILGGWEQGGKFYFDSVKKLPTEEMAIRMAYREEQLAYFNYGERVQMRTNPLNPLWKGPLPAPEDL